MTDVEDTLSEREKDDLEQAAIENERSKTKYGGGISEGHRGNNDE